MTPAENSIEGIVLRRTPYLDTGLVLDLLTPQGKTPVILRTGGKKSARYGETLAGSFVSVVLSHARGETLPVVREICPDTAEADIARLSPYRQAQLMFLCELTARTVDGRESGEDIYHFLYQCIRSLCRDAERFLCLRYGFHLCRLLGFSTARPEDSAGKYFDLQAGEFLPEKPLHRYYLTPANSALFFRLEDTSSPIDFSNNGEYLKAWHILMTYYALHIDGFHPPRSLDFLRELARLEHFGQNE